MKVCVQFSNAVCKKLKAVFRVCVPLIFAFAYIAESSAQNIVGGTVSDPEGNPLPGVVATIKGSPGIGAVTDIQGNFRISANPGDVISVSYIGYETVEYIVGTQSHIDIVLQDSHRDIDEVVVIGYGVQKKETLVGSVAVVRGSDLVQAPVANISNALVGRVPGLSSVQFSGEPGDNATSIYIRGVATMSGGNSSPLVMVDGVESTISTMNSIDPNDVESMSVLKDASATAVYGVKGANGVILINTKRGKTGTAKVDFSYRFGITELVSKLDMLGSEQYAILRNEAILNDADPSKYSFLFTEDEIWKLRNGRDFTEAEIWGNYPWLSEQGKRDLYNSPALYYTDYDYYDMQFGGTAPQHQYNINVSGGVNNVKYFASVGYFQQEGLFRSASLGGTDNNSRYDRYNFRSNIDIQVVKRLSVSIDLGGIVSKSSGILGASQDGSPDGQYARHKAMVASIFASTPFNGAGVIGGRLVNGFVYDANNTLNSKGGSGYSPMANMLTRSLLTNRQTDITATLKANHEMDYITKGLNLSGTLSYSDSQKKGVVTNPAVPQWKAMRNPDNPVEIIYMGGSQWPESVSDQQYKSKWNRIYLEAKLDYNRTFGRHAVTGLVLYNAQMTKAPWYEFQVPEGRLGLVGRVTYGYDNRYLVEFNMGYNGSENFAPGKRFGFFPAVSAGWVVTNEKFWPRNNFLTWLKIRGSYGEVGNDRIGGQRFLYLPSTWGMNSGRENYGYWWGNGNGSTNDMYYEAAIENNIGNPNVTWERARKSNIGVDINFFRDRLVVVVDLFNEDRDKILTQYLSQTNVTGADYPPGNIGKVNNRGFEVQATWTHTVSDFTYSIGGGVSYAVNKIIFMDEPAYPYAWMNTTGFSIGQYKGVKSEGFYNTDAEANNRPYVQEGGNMVHAGDIRYVDINGDGLIDDKDYVPLGYSNLPRMNFNMTLNLSWKGAYVSALFTGSAMGSMRMDDFYILNPFYMTNGAALQWHYDERWTPEKAAAGDKITFPRASLNNYNTQNKLPNDLWIRSSEFIRLKNLEVGYSLPGKWLKKGYVSGVRIYASSNNLFTWRSKLLPGYDPEQADWGGAGNGYLYPPTRSYNLGVNISF